MLGEGAYILLESGGYAEAEEFLAEAIRHNPQPVWRVQHAQALIKLNRLEEAEAELKAAERQEPNVAGLEQVKKMLEAARATPPATK